MPLNSSRWRAKSPSPTTANAVDTSFSKPSSLRKQVPLAPVVPLLHHHECQNKVQPLYQIPFFWHKVLGFMLFGHASRSIQSWGKGSLSSSGDGFTCHGWTKPTVKLPTDQISNSTCPDHQSSANILPTRIHLGNKGDTWMNYWTNWT